MQTLSLETLTHVTGGASKTSELTSSLSAITSSISDLKNTSNNNNSSSSTMLPLVMMLAMNRKQGGSIVATPGATVISG